MNNISLETKIDVNKSFIDELIANGWQEIENLQKQISAINSNSDNGSLVLKFLNGLLTSYYVFTGNLENLDNINVSANNVIIDNSALNNDKSVVEPIEDAEPLDVVTAAVEAKANFEPFEYFVDFDEPISTPLSDEDLYGKN